ncbi:hypothetical protein RvY_10908 [Ramazzottius varieornatus]|uniref:Gustatory receptor n=1 Tax=Ramazzottius varieornatus TaxID=947166 RepID=A0A1D1VEA6_RAMVA|nr:hypothetical protein RvY_10908 [Ramazzottius varieornatus]
MSMTLQVQDFLDMEENLLIIYNPQWRILGYFGFLPVDYHDPAKTFKKASYPLCCFRACITAVMIIGQLFMVYVIGGLFVFRMMAPSAGMAGGSYNNMVLKVLEMLPYVMMAFRSLCVMVVLLAKRRHCEPLRAETIAFFRTCFHGFLPRTRQAQRWSLLAIVMCSVSFVLHFSWDILQLYEYAARIQYDMELDSGLIYPRISVRVYFILWAVFVSVPYFLSQQVYSWALISAAILSSTLKSLKEQIRKEYTAVIKCGKGHLPLQQLSDKVTTWQTAHMEMLRFCQSLEHFFSWILFFIYCCDFAILLGYTAGFVNHIHEEGWLRKNIAEFGYAVLIFASYGTVFAIPFVRVYERSSGLLFDLHELTLVVKQFTGKESCGVIMIKFV